MVKVLEKVGDKILVKVEEEYSQNEIDITYVSLKATIVNIENQKEQYKTTMDQMNKQIEVTSKEIELVLPFVSKKCKQEVEKKEAKSKKKINKAKVKEMVEKRKE